MATGKERETASASYILNFYRDVTFLGHHVAVYQNVLLEVEFKYTGADFDYNILNTEEKNTIINTVQNVRYYINRTYIQYMSIKEKLKIKEGDENKIKKIQETINKEFIIKRNDAVDFCTELNKVLVNDVIQNILENSQDLLNSLFNNSNTENIKNEEKK